MKERFIGQAIRPVEGTIDTARMAAGEPGLPRAFVWRGREIRIVKIIRRWKESGPCHHGSGEQYLRKHWYEVGSEADGVLKIYFERSPRSRSKTSRWRLFSVVNQADV